MSKTHSKMVQYSLWHNCNNRCKFCLIDNKTFITKELQLKSIAAIKDNLNYVDWINEFNRGVSLLGGEIYFSTDPDIQNALFDLISDIIEKVLKPNHKNGNYYCKYSTVTNGMYNPEFLFKCVDKVVSEVGLMGLDLNFSYDIKYRYTTKEQELLVLDNIKKFQERYPEYILGVQSICTQYLIDEILHNNFLEKWYEANPHTSFELLYPHPSHTGIKLEDFFPKRESMFELISYLSTHGFGDVLEHFHSSVQNSARFKHTGLYHREDQLSNNEIDTHQKPELSKDKTKYNKNCWHSTLYQCYSDSDKCLLCDLNSILGE